VRKREKEWSFHHTFLPLSFYESGTLKRTRPIDRDRLTYLSQPLDSFLSLSLSLSLSFSLSLSLSLSPPLSLCTSRVPRSSNTSARHDMCSDSRSSDWPSCVSLSEILKTVREKGDRKRLMMDRWFINFSEIVHSVRSPFPRIFFTFLFLHFSNNSSYDTPM